MEINDINKLSDKYYMYKGLVLAPLASILGTIPVDIINTFYYDTPSTISFSFIFIYSIAYVVTFFIGLPIYYLLKKIKLLNIWSLLISAVIASYLIAVSIGIQRAGAIYIVAPGIAVSITFWYIYTHRSSNKAIQHGRKKRAG